MPHRMVLALLIAALAHCQAQTSAVLTGSRVRVEAVADAGQLRERFLARDGSAWVDLATTNREAPGPVSADGKTLAEELTIGKLRARRTLSLTAYRHWLKVTTGCGSHTGH